MADPFEVYKIAASLLGGGAVGAVITTFVTTYKNRIQPVGQRIDISRLFTPSFERPAFKPIITVSDGTNDYRFANLHVAEIQIVNRGNRDLPSFSFGVTLSSGDQAVYAEPSGLDRHHVATLPNPVTPAHPSSAPDFVLRPFNRGDSYTLKIFIAAMNSEPGPVSLGSAEAVRFSEMPSISETITQIASTAAVRIGPLTLSIR